MGECMKFNTNEMMLIAMFVALMAVGAYIRIDTPLVPVTLQFAVCAYAGVLLGAKKAMVSQVAYVLIGLIGFPVFTRGGGLFYIVEPTFGYLIGFVIAAYVIGRLTESMEDVNTSHSFFRVAFAVSTGLVIVYGVGALYLSLIMNTLMNTPMNLYQAFIAGVLPFIAADVLMGAVVIISAPRLLSFVQEMQQIKGY